MCLRAPLAFLLTAFALTAGACGDEGRESGDRPSGALHPWAIQARAEIPDALTLHTKVIARTCAPSGGVCHNAKEYPDLHTPGNFVTAVSRPCNRDLVSAPETVFDGCEPKGDILESGDFRTRIGWIGEDVYDPFTGDVTRPIRFAEAPDHDIDGGDARFERGGTLLVTARDVLRLNEGETDGWLDLTAIDYSTYLALETVIGGDPNGNGVFGAADAWAEVMPGRPEKSYLWGRITGTVPRTRMPLANQPLSNPEYVAIACWIETMGSTARVEEAIDYDACWYARAPDDHAGTGE